MQFQEQIRSGEYCRMAAGKEAQTVDIRNDLKLSY